MFKNNFLRVFVGAAVLFGGDSGALAPLQGLVKGDAQDIGQYDPLENILTRQFVSDKKPINKREKEKLELYKGAFKQGANLVNTCAVERFYTYPAFWAEESAKRSVAATLQYIGLDYATRAIVEYTKAFKLESKEFDNMVSNLVVNNCSENISVFSKKLLKNNFYHLKEKRTSFKLPNLEGSPYFSAQNIKRSSSFEVKRREFNFALKNFKAFCSWDGNVDNYGLLAPYLRNPFVMSKVFNHLTQKKTAWDPEREAVVLKKNDDAVLVACEDLLCRRRNFPTFNQIFPRMVGSSGVDDDLNVLYCNHFKETSLKAKNAGPTIRDWIQKQTLEESVLEPMNFLALMTGVPDLYFSADKHADLIGLLSNTVERRWDEWAEAKTGQLIVDLLYEESLFVDLAPSTELAKSSGQLGLVFDFTMGELDRELKVVDKISSVFRLEFPKSYLSWLRREYVQANNKSDFEKMKRLGEKFEIYVDLLLKEKESLFLIPLWNEKFSSIIAKDLLERLTRYGGSYFNDLSHEVVKVPVRFRFGLFALKYLRDRFKTKYPSQALTFNK
ncbi:MAG: hypothetical protein WEB87_02835 [Bacteriovoracaceae bacterium]